MVMSMVCWEAFAKKKKCWPRAHEAGTVEAFDRSKLGREETPPGWGGNFLREMVQWLVCSPSPLWFMADITIVNGVYKPTYNWGAPSPAGVSLLRIK